MTEEITDEEKLMIDELRNRLKNELEEDLHDDTYLFYRFLMEQEFNIDKTEHILRKHLEWRKIYDVRNILNFEKPEVIENYFAYVLVGYDKEGCPVRYCPFGMIDFIGILASIKFEDIVKLMIYEIESDTRILKEQSEKLKKNVDKIVLIADLNNLSFWQVTEKKSIHGFIFLMKILLNNYPGRFKAVFGINATIYFSIIYSLMKTVLPSNIMELIHVYSDESYKLDLLKIVDADELPAVFGGKKTDMDGDPLCLTKIKHVGEPVPERYFMDTSKRSLSDLPGVQKVTLSSGATHNVNVFAMEAGSYLEWEFETECRDIGFGVFFNEMGEGEEKRTELVPIRRIETEEHPEIGTLKCENPGTYIIVFDNTYSWVRSKEIYYRVKVLTPEEHESEMKQE